MKIKFLLLVTGLLSLTTIIAQVYPVRPQLSDKNSFSMILLPDPQSYNKFDANQPLFELQTAWIANSIGSLNVKGVLCTGDLVEQNEIRIPDGINGNQTSEEQASRIQGIRTARRQNILCRLYRESRLRIRESRKPSLPPSRLLSFRTE